jgi:hypothetical protein
VPNNRGESSSEEKKNRGSSPQKRARTSASVSEKRLPNKADDENPKPTERPPNSAREPAPTPKEELRLRLEERHGKTIPESVREGWIADVTRDLHDADLSVDAFLELDRSKTTNPAGVLNPPGYYRDIVKQLVNAGNAAVLESTLAINRVLQEPPKPQPKSQRCRAGRLSFDNDADLDSYCPDCQLGLDLRQIQRRKAAATPG